MVRPLDLAAEWSAATAAMRGHHLDTLRQRCGIPLAVIRDRMGVARIHLQGTFYTPSIDGEEVAALIATFEAPPHLSDGRWRCPNPVRDIVAFRPAEPGYCWSRCGIVAALGEEMQSDFSDAPVPVWRTPLAWLKAGATGLCLVDPDPAVVRDVLMRCQSLVAEDAGHGREIQRLMEKHWNRLPPIYVPERVRGAA